MGSSCCRLLYICYLYRIIRSPLECSMNDVYTCEWGIEVRGRPYGLNTETEQRQWFISNSEGTVCPPPPTFINELFKLLLMWGKTICRSLLFSVTVSIAGKASEASESPEEYQSFLQRNGSWIFTNSSGCSCNSEYNHHLRSSVGLSSRNQTQTGCELGGLRTAAHPLPCTLSEPYLLNSTNLSAGSTS